MSITGTSSTRALSSRYPVTDGITAETTKQEGHKETLEPQQSFLKKEDFILIS